MTMLTRCIEAPKEVKDKIMADHGIPPSTMDSALRFARSGDRSKEIRAMVLASGEAVIMNYLPQCETIHDAEGKMTQIFHNGLVLVIDKATELYKVYEEDEVILSGKVKSISALYKLQYMIEKYKDA